MLNRIFVLLVLAALLAACGGAPAAVEPSAATASADATVVASAVTEPSVAASAATKAEASSAPSVATDPAAASIAADDTRTISDAGGAELDVPVAPERVVALTEHDLDSALALGITPVGSVNGRGQTGLPAYLGERTDGIESVGSLAEPSLEKLVELDPDLILAGNLIPQIAALLPELQKIAPVVKTFNAGDDWKAAFGGTARALNREAEAEAFLADYDTRAAAIKAALPAGEAAEASVVRWTPDGPVVMVPTTFSSLVLADVGMERPAAHAELGGDHGAHSDPLSLEQLEVIDGDWLFVGALNTEGNTALDTARSNALFQQLDVVRRNHVVAVDGTVWTSIGGPLAALSVLDDVETALEQAGAGAAAGMVAESAQAAYQVPGFPAYAPADPLLEVLSRDNATVRVKHAYGETDIPAAPQRIYVNDPATLQILLSLGITPAGSTVFTPELPIALRERGAGVTLLPDLSGEGINLEQLAALEPDLILGHAQVGPGQITPEQYATLSEIAPAVAFTGNPFFYWKEATRELGDFFSVPEKAAAVLDEYENKLAGYRERATAAIGDETVSVLLLFDELMWLYSVGGTLDGRYVPLSPTGWAYRELRLTPGPEVRKLAGDELWAELSLELIPELKADHLVVFPNAYGGEETGSGLDDYLNQPLWQTVPAVQAGNVHVLTADNAIEGYLTTPFLIEAFLAELEQ